MLIITTICLFDLCPGGGEKECEKIIHLNYLTNCSGEKYFKESTNLNCFNQNSYPFWLEGHENYQCLSP